MFVPFLSVATLGKLGALSVWVVVLEAMLAVAVAVALLLGVACVRRRRNSSGL